MNFTRLRCFGWQHFLLLPMLWLSISTAGPHSHDFFRVPIVAAAFDAPARADAEAAFSESPAHDEHCLACEWAAASTAICVAAAGIFSTFATRIVQSDVAPLLLFRLAFAPSSRGPPSEILDLHFQNFRRTKYVRHTLKAAPKRVAMLSPS